MLPAKTHDLKTTNAKTCRACALARAGTGTRKRQPKLWKKCLKNRSICEINVILFLEKKKHRT